MSAPGSPAPGVNGLVVIDKGAGWTSHDVVARCRRIFGQRRVGHAGTLDPDATGVLLVGLGRVTRLLRFVSALPKSYTTAIVLGTATSTLDASGEVVGTYDMAHVSPAQVAAAAADLTGEIEQVPPMVSAIRVGGRRLHELAREGVEVERAARPVIVYRFDVSAAVDDGVFPITVTCSSGTYVRALAADLGQLLGGGAHLRRLRRVAVGSFTEADARPFEALELLPPAAALRDYASVAVDTATAARVAHGAVLNRFDGDGPWAVLDAGGSLLAVYEADGDRARPAVVLNGG